MEREKGRKAEGGGMAGRDVGPSIHELPASACVRAHGMGMRACAPTAQARRHRQNLELMSGGAVEQVDALLQGALEAAAVDGERPTHGRRAGGLGQRG